MTNSINFKAKRLWSENDQIAQDRIEYYTSRKFIKQFNIANWVENWATPERMGYLTLTEKWIKSIIWANLEYETVFCGYDGGETVSVKMPMYIDPLLMGGKKLLQGYYGDVYVKIDPLIRDGFIRTHEPKGDYVIHLDWMYIKSWDQNFRISSCGKKMLSVDGKFYHAKKWDSIPKVLIPKK